MYWSAIRNKSARCSSMQMRSVRSVCASAEEEEKGKKIVDTYKGNTWKGDSRWTEADLAESLFFCRGNF